MLLSIIQQTPNWVFILFCALLYLGISRSRPRTVPVQRIFLLPLAIGAYSLYSVYSAFIGRAASSQLDGGLALTALAAWLCAAALVLAILARSKPRHDVGYEPQTRQFLIPGSWFPLCWLMSVFLAKYAIAVLLAMRPELHGSTSFALTVGTLYGALSGSLAGGAWRIWRVLLDHQAQTGPAGAANAYAGK